MKKIGADHIFYLTSSFECIILHLSMRGGGFFNCRAQTIKKQKMLWGQEQKRNSAFLIDGIENESELLALNLWGEKMSEEIEITDRTRIRAMIDSFEIIVSIRHGTLRIEGIGAISIEPEGSNCVHIAPRPGR